MRLAIRKSKLEIMLEYRKFRKIEEQKPNGLSHKRRIELMKMLDIGLTSQDWVDYRRFLRPIDPTFDVYVNGVNQDQSDKACWNVYYMTSDAIVKTDDRCMEWMYALTSGDEEEALRIIDDIAKYGEIGY